MTALGFSRGLRAISLLGASALALAACGGSTTVTTSGAGGSGGAAGGAGGAAGGAGGATGGAGGATGGAGGSTGGAGGVGPGGSGGAAPQCEATDPSDVALAIDRVFLGDTDETGAPSASAWQTFGFDLDGLDTTNDFTGHCLPVAGAAQSDLSDGPGGVDNSFGRNIVPLLGALAPDISETVTAQIEGGSFTLLVRLEGLGAATELSPAPLKLWQGVTLDDAPSFDGTDCWPAAPESLADAADLESTTMLLDQGSVVADLFDSGPTSVTVTLALDGLGAPVALEIAHARVSFELDADHQGALHGRLAGVLDREAFVAQILDLAGSFDPSLCSGPTSGAILAQIEQASDIMVDGSQTGDAECDGISIGIGFTLAAVRLDGVGPASPPAPDPCP
jgi:hypothetical protein